jgi:hypothetical protein
MTAALDTEPVPHPIPPGPEMATLSRFYPDVTWTGTIHAGGLGPGSPEMTAIGRASHRLIQGGRWIVVTCSQEQYLLDGTFLLTWELHLVVGWDPAAGEYRATFADNYGRAGVLHGRADGDRLVMETVDDPPARLRMTWHVVGPTQLTWRNESSLDGRTWSVIETYRMTPTRRAVPAPG